MGSIIRNIIRSLVALWGIGNYYVRFVVIATAILPALVFMAALTNSQGFVAFVTIASFMAVVACVATQVDPLLIGVINSIPAGKKFLNGIFRTIAFTLFIGLYAMVIPISADKTWVAIVFVSGLFLAIASVAWEGHRGGHRVMINVATGVLIGFTIASFVPKSAKALGRKIGNVDEFVAKFMDCSNDEKVTGEGKECPTPTPTPTPVATNSTNTSVTTSIDNPPDYPICDDAGGTINLNFGSGGGGEAPLRTDCWSAKFKVMPNEDFIIRTDNPSDNGHQYLFANGEVMTFGSDGASSSSKAGRSIFRLRGVRGNGHATVTIRRQ